MKCCGWWRNPHKTQWNGSIPANAKKRFELLRHLKNAQRNDDRMGEIHFAERLGFQLHGLDSLGSNSASSRGAAVGPGELEPRRGPLAPKPEIR